MGCSSSTQTQSQESSRPVTKTGVTNGLKQSASDGNSSIPHENEICLDKTKQCAVGAKVDANDETGPINHLLAGEPRVVKPLATDGTSSTCEEEYPEKAGSPGSEERVQAECLKSADKVKNPGASKESVPPISAGKNELPGTEEKDNREMEKGTQPVGKFVEIEIFGTIKEIKPLITASEVEATETGEHNEHRGVAEEADPQRTMKENKHLITSEEAEPQETVEDIQCVDTDRKTVVSEENNYVGTAGETETSGTLEETEHERIAEKTKTEGTGEETEHEETAGKTEPSGTHEESEHEGTAGENKTLGVMEETKHEGTAGETKPSGTMEKVTLVTGEKNNFQGTVEDNEFPEILGEVQPLGAPGKNNYSRTARGTEPPERVEKTQLVEAVGGIKPPQIAEGTEENMKPLMEVARKINMNEEKQAIEGETGERVETETHSEIVSEGSETKEEETGEAVDTTAATETELTNSKK